MTERLSNSEIQDVLSSIRRLVSEDRRTREAAPAVPPPSASGKFLLTEALRVETVEEVEEEVLVAEITGEAVEDAADLSAEDEQDRRWPAAEATAPPAPAAIRPASVLEDDIASLESTIAELEAAVAGIGAEFEPDGSEVLQDEDDPVARALDDAFEDGFAVDAGGPGRFDAEDTTLSSPVTGDALRPAAHAAGEGPEAADDPAAEAERRVAGPEEITFLRRNGAVLRPDWQVISGAAGVGATSGLTGRLHLGAASDAGEPEEALVEEAAPPSGEVARVDMESLAAAVLGGEPSDTALAAEEEALAIDAPAEESGEGAFDAAETEPASDEYPAPDAAVEAGTAEEPTAPAAAPLASVAESDEDNDDLFGAGEDAVIDMEMLRDLIAQVIREELQGPLGERITRNVRKLVRQEIARALETQKFD